MRINNKMTKLKKTLICKTLTLNKFVHTTTKIDLNKNRFKESSIIGNALHK